MSRKKQKIAIAVDGSELIAAARRYLGVPWQHQGRDDQGIDCCGFIAESVIDAGAVRDVQFIRDYARQENGERMLYLLQQHCDPVERGDEQIGNVLALCDEQVKYPDRPTHLAFLSQMEPYWQMIHASEHGVVEHRMDIRFKRRIVSVWRIRAKGAGTDFSAGNVEASESVGENSAEDALAPERRSSSGAA
jgi:cell wall-associated NlpC family hydrolase